MEKVNIRVELDGDLADQFLSLKQNRGLKNNTEVIRQLILEAIKRDKDTTEAEPVA
jgi:metal-responsive CopG/Arc/MetJ family transcriptional regulator